MVSYGVALLGLVVSGTLYLHVSHRSFYHCHCTFNNSVSGRREVCFCSDPRKYAPPASQHCCALGYLVRLHDSARRTGIHSGLINSHLQLPHCARGIGVLRTSCNEPSRLAMAVRPRPLQEGTLDAEDHIRPARRYRASRIILLRRSNLRGCHPDHRCLRDRTNW